MKFSSSKLEHYWPHVVPKTCNYAMKTPPFRFFEWPIPLLRSKLVYTVPSVTWSNFLILQLTVPQEYLPGPLEFNYTPCLLNLSFPCPFHTYSYLFNVCLPWLTVRSMRARTLLFSQLRTGKQDRGAVWFHMGQMKKRRMETQVLNTCQPPLTPFTFFTWTPT